MYRKVLLCQCLLLFSTKWLLGEASESITAHLISIEGYPSEIHHVTTHDGYILELHRIPHGRNGPTVGTRQPVFLMHGLFGASNNYVAIGYENSIGFNLADAGFDVWMGNARGNRDSRRHVSLDPDDAEEKMQFWDFSWEEIGMYDVAEMTDYVRATTGFAKIHYVGHSQGTTAFFVLNSMRPEYNERFASAHLLAPVSFKKHFPNSALSTAALLVDGIYAGAVRTGFVEVDKNYLGVGFSATRSPNPDADLWTEIVREIRGVNNPGKNLRSVDVDGLFGGAALKQVAHYGQNIRSKAFQRWDYGLLRNPGIYGSLRPPSYDMTKVTVKTTLYYAPADELSGVEDVLEMERVLPNAVARRLANEVFSHTGYIFDPDVKHLVTDYIIENLKADE